MTGPSVRDNDVVRVVRRIAVVQLIVAVAAVAVLIAAILVAENARHEAARDSCTLIVGLARAAAGTSQRALTQANAYIAHTQLRDCGVYAGHVAPTPLP